MKTFLYLLPLTIILLFTSACSQVSRHPVYHGSSSNNSKSVIERQRSVSQRQTISRPQVYQPENRPQQIPGLSTTRYRMLQIAKSTIGVPYRWGGNNPREGFDCSGLMKYVHKQATGIIIPRTAAQQRDNSKTISYNQLQPGDMLFFKTGKRSNHVGIYVGNRQFVHAPSGGKRVKITSMDSAYWHKRFVKFGSYL